MTLGNWRWLMTPLVQPQLHSVKIIPSFYAWKSKTSPGTSASDRSSPTQIVTHLLALRILREVEANTVRLKEHAQDVLVLEKINFGPLAASVATTATATALQTGQYRKPCW